MQLLFADTIDGPGTATRIEALRASGHQVSVEPGLGADDLPDRISGVDVLAVRSTRVTAATLRAADRLSLVVRAGAGTDNIDTATASDLGVHVSNVPGRNAVAVAELTIGLLVAIDRGIADSTADLRAGRWDKARYSRADGLMGRTIALFGLGDIGLAVAERAKAFGMTVTALRRDGRTRSAEGRIRSIGVRLVDDRDELLGGADVVSLHLPAAPDTMGLVDADFLAALRPGAILLNTARADLIDETALVAALDRGDLRVGLDVWPDEPGGGTGTIGSPLARHPRVVGSHHIGASTAQAQAAVADGCLDVIEAFLAGRVLHCVNLVAGSLGAGCIRIRHLDRVGVLADVFAQLRAHGLSVQQMDNQIFAGANAAVATVHTDGRPPAGLLEALRRAEHVLSVTDVSDGTR